jgi:hypothetical protein
VAVKHGLLDILDFVLPFASEVITDCWTAKPDYPISFDNIMDRLRKMKFTVIQDVTSSKISEFVTTIEAFESGNAIVHQETSLQFDLCENRGSTALHANSVQQYEIGSRGMGKGNLAGPPDSGTFQLNVLKDH